MLKMLNRSESVCENKIVSQDILSEISDTITPKTQHTSTRINVRVYGSASLSNFDTPLSADHRHCIV